MTALEEELLRFLRTQAESDVDGKLEAIEGSLDRLYNLFLKQQEEHKASMLALQGELRGMSLRLSQVEREQATLDERTKLLMVAVNDHGRNITDSLVDARERATDEVTFMKRNWLAVVATCVAIASTVYGFFRK